EGTEQAHTGIAAAVDLRWGGMAEGGGIPSNCCMAYSLAPDTRPVDPAMPARSPVNTASQSPISRLGRAQQAVPRIFVAPMMEYTDRHCRYFLRLLSPSAVLYTEMITSAALVRGNDAKRLLAFDASEH